MKRKTLQTSAVFGTVAALLTVGVIPAAADHDHLPLETDIVVDDADWLFDDDYYLEIADMDGDEWFQYSGFDAGYTDDEPLLPANGDGAEGDDDGYLDIVGFEGDQDANFFLSGTVIDENGELYEFGSVRSAFTPYRLNPVIRPRDGNRMLVWNQLSDGRCWSGSPWAEGCFRLTNPVTSFTFGRVGDETFVGNWNGRGGDTLGMRRGNHLFLNNTLAGGNAEHNFSFGRAGDEVLVGDWNGNRMDTFGMRRGNTFFLTNRQFGTGNADIVFTFGRAQDQILIGNWNGRGGDSPMVRRGNEFFVNNDFSGGTAEFRFSFGRADDTVLVGDWNGDGRDSLAIRRGQFIITSEWRGNALVAHDPVRFGNYSDTVIAGNWRGGFGGDTFAVRRPAPSNFSRDVSRLINDQRRARGLGVLEWDYATAGAALQLAEYVVSPTGLNLTESTPGTESSGRGPTARLAAARGGWGRVWQVTGAGWASQRNITAAEMVTGLMNNPDTREALMTPDAVFFGVGDMQSRPVEGSATRHLVVKIGR
ncbi:MAG: hypothetical protein FWG11_03855 [Promicromonosporaceae bacterium]|nr:hypothetical protein [Promicromonosporaceae bacterium]